jgi:phosphoglycerate dehydrogenase-like enzyme
MKLRKVVVQSVNKNIPVRPRHLEILAAAAPGCEFVIIDADSELAEKASDADAIFLWPFMSPELTGFCLNAPNLRWVHIYISGVDQFMNSAAGRVEGLRVSSTKGIHGPAMSDHALAYIFSLLRQFPAAMRAQAENRWSHTIAAASRESIGHAGARRQTAAD